MRRLLALTAIVALSACGGGSHNSVIPAGATAQQGMLKVTFTLPGTPTAAKLAKVPRGRHYISYGANGVTLVAADAPGSPTIPSSGAAVNAGSTHGVAFDISEATGTGAGKACTTSGTAPSRTCTLTIPAPPGNYNVVLSFWDAAPADNAHAPSGNVLSQSPVVQTAIVNSSSGNTLNFTFNPVVHDVVLNLDKSVVPYQAGGTQTLNLSVVLKDSTGSVIVDDGTGNTLVGSSQNALTVTLSPNDTPAATTTQCSSPPINGYTTVNSVVFPATYSITTVPTSSIPVQYNGGCLISDTIAPSVSGDTVGGSLGTATYKVGGISQETTLSSSTLTAVDDAIVGKDGSVYVFGSDLSNGKIDVYPPGGTMTEVSLSPATDCPVRATSGADGNVWFVAVACGGSGGSLGYITTDSLHAVGEFPVAGSAHLNGIASDSSGKLWFDDMTNETLYSASANTTTPSISSPSYIVASPSAPTGVTDVGAGGSLASGQNYQFYITGVRTCGGSCETLVSAATAPVTTSAGSDSITMTLPALPLGINSYNVYASNDGGATIYQQATAQAPGTYTFTSFNAVTTAPTQNTAAAAFGLTFGGDGNLWMTEQSPANDLLGYSPSSGLVQIVPGAAGGAPTQSVLPLDATHNVYVDLNDGICVAPTSGSGTACSSLTSGYTASAMLGCTCLAVGADGNVYYTETNGTTSAIGQMPYNAPAHTFGTAADYTQGVGSGDTIDALAADPFTSTLWFPALNTGTRSAGEFRLP